MIKLNSFIALVIAGSIPLSGLCATKADVSISATVTKDCNVAVDTNTVNFGSQTGFNIDKFPDRTVSVTSNCAGGTGKLTFLASESEGNNIVLNTGAAITGTSYSNKLKVNFKIADKDDHTFDSSKKIVYSVGQGNVVTKLTFKPVNGQNVIAGEYKGTLQINVDVV
ncbi:Dr family adhesin structural subunit [Serratia ureilytica]|uniref:Dr family adhesin structural subunit n=1 Tax=Serratia ureilytica TaxID=300181 RepID=UPI001AA12407|nr:Dr family adhesin structural subunit [Serratia ureilytica]MBO1811267.1 Dr family adhesin structural subunit [Serratia ureilytica]